MKRYLEMRAVVLSFCLVTSLAVSAQSNPGALSADELKKVVPSVYYFSGQSASVQLRNSGGFRAAGNKLVLAGLVDTSGYSSDIQAKYQGFLITEVKLSVEGTSLAAGQYGFGFSKDGKFLVMDVGANDLFSVTAHRDDKLAHPVPLKVVSDAGGYRLYAGRRWVSLKAQ
jgi:hypothetical protein